MYQQLDYFIEYFRDEKGKSKNTLISYERDVKQMLDYLFSDSKISRVSEISPIDVRAYIDYMKKNGKSASTISRSIASIRAFFTYLFIKKEIVSDPSADIKAPKVLKREAVRVNETDIARILKQPSDNTSKGIRDKAMLELMCDTGLSASNIIGLNIDDVDLRNCTVVVRYEAGKVEKVNYHKAIQKYLSKYMLEARTALLSMNDSDSFFINCHGGSLTRQGFWKIVKKYGEQAGIEAEITPHMMSHNKVAGLHSCVDDK